MIVLLERDPKEVAMLTGFGEGSTVGRSSGVGLQAEGAACAIVGDTVWLGHHTKNWGVVTGDALETSAMPGGGELSCLTGSKDLYPVSTVGMFQGFLWEGDFLRLPKINLCQCWGVVVDWIKRDWTQGDHSGSW